MSEASHHLTDGLAVFHNDKGRWGRRMDEATCCRVPLNLDFNFGVKLCWLPHPGAMLWYTVWCPTLAWELWVRSHWHQWIFALYT